MGLTQGAISQWEKGETYPRADLLPRIALLYKCKVDDLFGIAESSAQ
ncbi:MAG: helix-turn-helix domain-containing protein [Oscillospiraceae bacterium]|nr:helix-turn-helix domain-containing protein [Oscillospiraceae bacterium]